jgi:hypothetical protein
MSRFRKFLRYLAGNPRSARFRRANHRTLNPLLQLPRLLGCRMGFVSCQMRNRFTWIRSRFVKQVVSNGMRHLGMAFNMWRDKTSDMFLIFEHKVDYSLPIYLISWLRRKPVFFFVHETQQSATLKLRSWIALHMCRAWVRSGEFYPIYISLDDRGLDPKVQFQPEKRLTIPHPHPLAERPVPTRPNRIPGTPFRIGIIETNRKEKSVRHLYHALREAQDRLNFKLIVGTALWNKAAWLDETDVEIVDTSSEFLFAHYLANLDIFVSDFQRSEYLFRPSGVLVDAGMNGCYVVCPDFPIFRAQTQVPVSIGSLFSNIDQLPEVLEAAMVKISSGAVDFETWRQYHRIANIAEMFKGFLAERARLNA